MKPLLFALGWTLVLAAPAAARPKARTFVGCVQGRPGQYTLVTTNEKGKPHTYFLGGDRDFAKDVGHQVRVGSVNFDQWSKTPIWKDDASACVGHMAQSQTGTLRDPKISEAGRQFLADLLIQLTDQQLRDLFEVARVKDRSRRPNSAEPPVSVDEWMAAFKHKREEIVTNRCKS